MSDERKLQDQARVRQAVVSLGEHFDTVHVFVTRHESGSDDGGTGHCNLGCGNWYAREGQIREWLTIQEEITRETCRVKRDE